MSRENMAEPSSPVSRQSAEYSLDNSFSANDKKKMSNASPQKPPKPSGKTVTCNVFLLDGESIEISLDKNDIGRALFDKVCKHQDLIEKDYFGFTYTDDRGPSHLKYWLNLDKKISKQKKKGAWVFEFALKFYPPDPTTLRESYTRWLVVLQVRRDLLSGRLPCTFSTYALLGSYNVQAIVGEFEPSEHGHSYDHIKDMAFAPNQTPELLEKIAELHRHHKGLTPDEAEKCFLDNAKKLAMYGVDMHKAKDADNTAVMLGVCGTGLVVFRDKLRISRFVWPRILKLSYKRNHFYIRVRPGEMEKHDHMIMFKLDNHRLAKRLWKTCVEHHAFFRLRESDRPSNNVAFPRFGSKFRYSGRTLYQTRQTAALLDRPPPFFERSLSGGGRNSMSDQANRSRSMDELGRGHHRDRHNDSAYDPNRSSLEYDPNRTGDENDRRDFKGVSPAYAYAGKNGRDGMGAGDEGTLSRHPYDSDTADRRDRLPSQGDATLERERGRGRGMGLDDSMGLSPGQEAVDPYAGETEKERRKREKEEDKRRKKEAEEARKAGKGKKGGKDDLNTSEDRLDNMDVDDATARALGRDPGSMGVHGDQVLLSGPLAGQESTDDKDLYEPYNMNGDDTKDMDGYQTAEEDLPPLGGSADWRSKNKDVDSYDGYGAPKGSPGRSGLGDPGWEKGNLSGPGRYGDPRDPRYGQPGYGDPNFWGPGGQGGYDPYGTWLGMGARDTTGVVGDEAQVDNKQDFLPLNEPIRASKEQLLSGSDGSLPFFNPAATSTVGRGKVPPPVPPKGGQGLDDSFNYKTERDGIEETRVVQKVVVSGEDDDDIDFDSALVNAIRSVTEFNPDMSVERIECVQQIEDVKDGK